MALTGIQRDILAVISRNRISGGERYVAGGTALNLLLEQPRLSRDIDLFHDTREALALTWPADRSTLEHNGFSVGVVRELPGLVEATVRKGEAGTLVQWAVDSAFRFFPLVSNDQLGLSLHPFDLATNKVLALVGRLEVRDWIDVQACASLLQELGYLAWAACGKDPGLNPDLILSEAARSARYTQEEVDTLDFDEGPPDAAALSRSWKGMLREAAAIVGELPPENVGTSVLAVSGALYRGDVQHLKEALEKNQIQFHKGSIRGAFPAFPGSSSSPRAENP
jgi:hypothetical protein